jgi:hypothetical protein
MTRAEQQKETTCVPVVEATEEQREALHLKAQGKIAQLEAKIKELEESAQKIKEL